MVEENTGNTSEDDALGTDRKVEQDSAAQTEQTEKQEAEQSSDASGFDLNRVIEDAKRVATQPVEFYRQLSPGGGFAEPCIFLLVMAVAMGLLATLFSFFGLGVIGSMAIGFTSFIVLPLFALIGSFIGALIMFVVWKLMGSTRDYEAAYRSIAYASVVYPITPLVSWIPYLGTIIVTGWGMYLIYIATVEVHGIKQQKAQLVIGVLAAISLLMQLSGESATRALQSSVEEPLREWQQGMEQFNKSMQGELGKELSAEDAERLGKQFGESLGQLGKAAEELGRNTENNEEMTPEEAGRALGSFFKGLSEGVQEIEQRPEPAENETGPSASSVAADSGGS